MFPLGAAVLPVAVAITEWRPELELVDAAYAIPVAFLLSAVAVRLARRARRSLDRTLGRIGGGRTARAGRVLGWLGVYISLIAAVAMGVYHGSTRSEDHWRHVLREFGAPPKHHANGTIRVPPQGRA